MCNACWKAEGEMRGAKGTQRLITARQGRHGFARVELGGAAQQGLNDEQSNVAQATKGDGSPEDEVLELAGTALLPQVTKEAGGKGHRCPLVLWEAELEAGRWSLLHSPASSLL